MSREINPFGLRMPIELRELLEKSAELNHRSLNAEIVMRLDKSVTDEPIFTPQIKEPNEAYSPEDKKQLNKLIESLPKKKRQALLKFIETL